MRTGWEVRGELLTTKWGKVAGRPACETPEPHTKKSREGRIKRRLLRLLDTSPFPPLFLFIRCQSQPAQQTGAAADASAVHTLKMKEFIRRQWRVFGSQHRGAMPLHP
jgi:hypothetical protein